jgi:peptidoglycan/xylan/chitin deacetylase (PgdA/CDA1 family)
MQAKMAITSPAAVKPSVRSGLRHSAIKMLGMTGRLGAARRAIAQRGDIVVLTLHRVVPDEEVGLCRSPRGMVLRTSLFLQLIEYLSEFATVISPNQVGRIPAMSARPRVLLTFDDGWLDNILVAKPILSRAGMQACFFMVTEFAGVPAPFWPEQLLALLMRLRVEDKLALIQPLLRELRDARDTPQVPCGDETLLTWLKVFPPDQLRVFMRRALGLVKDDGGFSSLCDDPKERLMTWDQLGGLVADGHLIGSHTNTHALLPLLDRRRLIDELQGSRRALQERLPGRQNDHIWLSYPNGSVNPTVRLAAFEAGYRNAFSNSVGTWGRSSDPLVIPRVNIWDGSLIDSNGRFSPDHADYALFWKSGHERFTPTQ